MPSSPSPTARSTPLAFSRWLVCVAAIVALSAPVHAERIVSSPADSRVYEALTLENGLRVVLVSDPATEVAAASLDVGVGSGDEPSEWPGLAHFLEHMLFLGTEPFPDAGDYRAYINAAGGNQNAYTAHANTNYHFEVEASALGGALDRFSAFFISPLMSERYVERELNAVHAEYTTRLRSDGQRGFEAFRQAINPAHPLSRFTMGNRETLSDREGAPVRAAMLDFYEATYHAGNMALAVLGRESIEELTAMVEARFSGIRGGRPWSRVRRAPMFEPGRLPARLDVTPIRDTRALSLAFSTPPRRHLYTSKPASYIANMIGHEGRGSLLSELRRRGLANSLSAGSGFSYEDSSTFEVSIGLTPAGLERVNEIIALVFRYIDLIRAAGPERSRFDEQARLAAIDFRFQDQRAPGGLTRALAAAAHIFPLRDVLRAGYAWDEFSPEAITALLDELRPDNVLVRVIAPGLETNATTRWFSAPYALRSVTAEELAAWGEASAPDTLALPEPNPFIAEDLAMVGAASEPALPTRIVDEPGFELWHTVDTSFERPLGSFYASLRSPVANDTPRHAVLTRLLVGMLGEQLTESLYPATLAGLDLSVYPHLRGLSFRAHGYNDRLDALVDMAGEALANPVLEADTFERVREALVRSWRNDALGSPYSRAMSGLRNVLLVPNWNASQMLAASEGITLEDLREFAPRLFASLDVVTLAHGNLDEADARAMAERLRSTLLEGRKAVEVPRAGVVQLARGSTHWLPVTVDHDDVAVVRYYQAEARDHRARAATAMVAHLTSSPFYTSLRTEQQLGYVVFSGSMPLLEVPGMVFVVQSPDAAPALIESRYDAFVEDVASFLGGIGEAEFDAQREALLARLLERDSSLQARTNRYWVEMDRSEERLDDRDRMAEALRALTIEDVREAAAELLTGNGPRISVHAARDGTGQAPVGKAPIEDPLAFRAGLPRFDESD